MKEWISGALDFLYPPKCALCGRLRRQEEKGICRHCYESRGLILENYCRKCGKNLYKDDFFCYDCSRHDHEFEAGHALFPYAQIKDAIWVMKYGREKWRALALAELMEWLFETEVRQWGIEALAFVPQHFLALGQKGYNPPAAAARYLAARFHLPLTGVLAARHKAHAQKELSAEERQKNLKNIYFCKEKVPFRRILLIDDVYTTGATIDACSHLLKESGAEKVYFLTMAIGSFNE